MRVDKTERSGLRGREVTPDEIHFGDVFLDPWGIAWRAAPVGEQRDPAPGHVSIRATQLTVNDQNEVVDAGKPVFAEIPIDQHCKVLSQLTWKEELEKLFFFDPDA